MGRVLALLTVSLWLAMGPARAGLEQFEFVDAAEEQRYRALISELRCLVCQNQSLADSGAGLADDLRIETYKLMKSGRSDAEVIQFLVDRYGDFVLYRPPVKPSTYLLWFGPVVLFLLAAWWVARIVSRQRPAVDRGLSEEEHRRAASLLGEEERS